MKNPLDAKEVRKTLKCSLPLINKAKTAYRKNPVTGGTAKELEDGKPKKKVTQC